MARTKPSAGDEAILRGYHSSEEAHEVIMKNYPYVRHPFVTTGYLTTDGVQYSTITSGSTGVTSKSTAVVTSQVTTLNWPGLDGEYVDEMEAGLTIALASSGVVSSSASTLGWVWEMKDSDESTWTIISSGADVAGVDAWTERTNSGYVKCNSGYNKLPLHLRLKGWGKTASHLQVKIKNSSYVKIKPKKV